MDTTMPHANLAFFPSEEEMHEFFREYSFRGGEKARMYRGVIGDWGTSNFVITTYQPTTEPSEGGEDEK
jgi:hypothetical protein